MYAAGIHKESNAVPMGTKVTEHNWDYVFKKDVVRAIINEVSRLRGGRKITQNEVPEIVTYIRNSSGIPYYGKSLKEVIGIMAGAYFTNQEERDAPALLVPDKRDVASGTISEYQRDELMQLTPNENQYKFAAFADRRGNAYLDKKRDEGERSAPDDIAGVASGARVATYGPGLGTPGGDAQLHKTMEALYKFVAADSIDSMFARNQAYYLTYQNVNLPRISLILDSRNRVTSSEAYTWYIHAAGTVGGIGNVRLIDTLQQIVQVRLLPFWLPFDSTRDLYYHKIHLSFDELNAQGIISTQFLDPNQSAPTSTVYQYELEIREVRDRRAYLVPKRAEFSLHHPLARLETMTAHFFTPFGALYLEPDRGTYTVTYGNPTLFSLTSPLPLNNHLASGDLVYVINLNSSSSSINAAVNGPAGFFITRLNASEFTIPFDTSSLSGGLSGVLVYYGQKRIFMQLEFVCLER